MVKIESCEFTKNESHTGTGGIIFELIGGGHHKSLELEIKDCTFTQNYGNDYAVLEFTNTVAFSSAIIKDCIFTENNAKAGAPIGTHHANGVLIFQDS